MKKFSKTPLAIALGTTMALGTMSAQASIFEARDLASGYMLAAAGDAKTPTTDSSDSKTTTGHCGANMHGNCGGHMKAGDGMCGEGRCGAQMFKAMDKDGDGKLTEEEFLAGRKAMHDRMHNGDCADGKCNDGCCGSNR